MQQKKKCEEYSFLYESDVVLLLLEFVLFYFVHLKKKKLKFRKQGAGKKKKRILFFYFSLHSTFTIFISYSSSIPHPLLFFLVFFSFYFIFGFHLFIDFLRCVWNDRSYTIFGVRIEEVSMFSPYKRRHIRSFLS